MPILQDIIANIGLTLGKTPQRPDDFWDRISGRPLYQQQMRTAELDAASRRRIAEQQQTGKNASITHISERKDLLPLETTEAIKQALGIAEGMTPIQLKQLQNTLMANRENIVPTAGEQVKAATNTRRQTAEDIYADRGSNNPLLRDQSDIAQELSRLGLLEARQGVTQAEADPTTGTKYGRDALAAGDLHNLNLLNRSKANEEITGLKLGNTKTGIQNQYLPQQIQTEMDMMAAQADNQRASAYDTRAVSPYKQRELESRADYYKAGALNRAEIIPLGGDNFMIRHPDGTVELRDALVERLDKLENRGKVPPTGAVAPTMSLDPSKTGAPQEKVDMDRLQLILRGMRGE